MRTTFVVIATASLVAASVLGGTAAAHAYTDSGVGSRGCAGQFGQLSVYQQGSGNSWAPGDWTDGWSNSQWNADSSAYRWISDYQYPGTGGGSYRNVTNGDYTTLTAGCSRAG
ncbi:MAG: hypothetical protein H7146_13865 [Burkholderiaceae bacterium]|nr:hypothetical protein [Microbacteriaceae bacterium]